MILLDQHYIDSDAEEAENTHMQEFIVKKCEDITGIVRCLEKMKIVIADPEVNRRLHIRRDVVGVLCNF